MPTIVAVADTHLYHGDHAVPDGDVLIHAGDMTRGGSLAELGRALEFFRALPHRVKIFVAGNHERCLEERPAEARRLLGGFDYLQDSGVERLGLRFWGSPWQPAYNDWAFNLPRGRPLADKWASIPDGIDVLVTHGPPRGFGDSVGVWPGNEAFQRMRAGCEDLLARVREVRPLLHVYGHIHQGRGHWRDGPTLLVNATCDECMAPPTVIRVDPGARTAMVAGTGPNGQG